MARSNIIRTTATLLIATVCTLHAAAQTNGPTPIASGSPSTSTPSPTSSASVTDSTASGPAQSATDGPETLWNIANSLLSSYYPSSTITQVDSLTWPATVVIQSSTYSVHSEPTGTPSTSVLAESTGEPSKAPTNGLRSDEKLGIGIGVAVGAVALILLGLVLCCLRRRKRTTGALFKRRPTPSVTDSDIEGWRSPEQPNMSTMSSGPSREWTEKYNRMPTGAGAGAPMQPPPMALHPAFTRQHTHWSNHSSSDENPFFTPSETPDHNYQMSGANGVSALGAGAFVHRDTGPYEKETGLYDAPSQRYSSDSMRRASRPPTPFNPMLMMGGGAGHPHEPERHNPFSSPEDDEANDIVSPIIPTRSPERRHSPMVHYPSWSEVSEFDFNGSGGRGHRSLRGQSSSEDDGGDGYRPLRESVYGRHEMA